MNFNSPRLDFSLAGGFGEDLPGATAAQRTSGGAAATGAAGEAHALKVIMFQIDL